jgi:hypothetical protein
MKAHWLHLRVNLLGFVLIIKSNKRIAVYLLKGGYPDLNRELTVPHTAALPIELYPPFYINLESKLSRRCKQWAFRISAPIFFIISE